MRVILRNMFKFTRNQVPPMHPRRPCACHSPFSIIWAKSLNLHASNISSHKFVFLFSLYSLAAHFQFRLPLRFVSFEMRCACAAARARGCLALTGGGAGLIDICKWLLKTKRKLCRNSVDNAKGNSNSKSSLNGDSTNRDSQFPSIIFWELQQQ